MIAPSLNAPRPRRAFFKRVQSCAAVLLLGLYSAAVWHGTGDHHHHPATAGETACHSCSAHSCAPATEPPSPEEPAGEPTDAHECGLCVLLHAPATPGLLTAIHAPVHGAPASPAAITPSVKDIPLGFPPSRAPPASA